MATTVTETGMVREAKADKLNYLDYLDPLALERFARHMKKGEANHTGDNWKKGGYGTRNWLQSLFRHLHALQCENEGVREPTGEDHASAIWFNIQGYLAEEERTKLEGEGA